MKIGLEFGETISGKYYPAGCVIDIFQPDAEALIAAGRAHSVPDGTMARKKAYGVVGCMPPDGFNKPIRVDNTSKSSLRDAISEIKEQKTNTLKK